MKWRQCSTVATQRSSTRSQTRRMVNRSLSEQLGMSERYRSRWGQFSRAPQAVRFLFVPGKGRACGQVKMNQDFASCFEELTTGEFDDDTDAVRGARTQGRSPRKNSRSVSGSRSWKTWWNGCWSLGAARGMRWRGPGRVPRSSPVTREVGRMILMMWSVARCWGPSFC